jgi:outer membrane protein OmpA-like peptidoglycan-associated protein
MVMVSNLIEMFMGGSAKELTSLASGILGESAENTSQSITKLIPLVLGGMAQKASTTTGASDLFKMVTSPNIDAGISGNLSNLLAGDVQNNPVIKSGIGIAASLFGADKANGLISSLASGSSISSSSSSSLIGMVMPLIFGGLKHVVNDQSLDARGLSSLLLGQKDFLKKADIDRGLLNSIGIPSSDALLNKLPVSIDAGKAAIVGATTASASAFSASAPKNGLLIKWLPWVGAAVVAFLLWNVFSAKKPEAPKIPAPMSFQYPGKVYFAKDSKNLDDAAKKVITNLQEALQKDASKLSITGFTDKTGDENFNAELAKNRAIAVKDALVAAGVKEDSIALKKPEFVTGAQDDQEARRVDITRE